jgi:flavin-dependent dehydrogenase
MPDLDVGIVGAGPAGAAAAWLLARAGARVAIFDPSHPREKPCGGGVTGRAIPLVHEALAAAPVRPIVITHARFEATTSAVADGPPPAEVALPADGLSPATGLVVLSRAELDRALLDAAVRAGARLVPERVVAVQAAAGSAEIVTTRSRHAVAWLLGADGAGSLVRRRLARPFRRDQLSIATGFFAHGVSGTSIVIACVSEPTGYVWSFPRADHLAIGIGADADAGWTAAALRAHTLDWAERARLAPGARLTPYAWPIPTLGPGDFDQERPAGPRWMLLGDAAGLVDPLTREGIYWALASGAWATEALAAGTGDPAVRYAARLREEAYPELGRAARAKAGFFRPAFTRLLVEALHGSARIRAVMADLVSGRQPYRGLRRRLLATGELGWAWRLLRLELAHRLVLSPAARPDPAIAGARAPQASRDAVP